MGEHPLCCGSRVVVLSWVVEWRESSRLVVDVFGGQTPAPLNPCTCGGDLMERAGGGWWWSG